MWEMLGIGAGGGGKTCMFVCTSMYMLRALKQEYWASAVYFACMRVAID